MPRSDQVRVRRAAQSVAAKRDSTRGLHNCDTHERDAVNDLAEMALHGLDAARRFVRDRPLSGFAVAGFACSAFVVVAGGRVGAAGSTRPLTTWLGLQDAGSARTGEPLPRALLPTAIVVLIMLWLVVVEFVRRRGSPPGRVWWVALAWGLPFAVGPPLLDTSVYGSAAFGLLQRRGHDPYEFGVVRLGDAPVVTAIDPGSRGAPSSSGPLGTILQHLSVSIGAGSTLAAVLVLRIVGILAAVWIGRSAATLGNSRPDCALTLTVLNPIVLLYVVSAAHLDGVMTALVLASLVAARQRRWLVSIILACLAASVSGQAFVVLVLIIVVHHAGRRREAGAWQLVGRDVLVAALVVAAAGMVVPHGFGWVETVHKQFAEHTPFSITGGVSAVLSPIVRGASYDDLAIGGRITVVTAMVCVVGYVIATARHRPLDVSAGYALLAMALLAPVLHPWYLLWGTLCLAPTATGERRIAVLTLSAGACALTPWGFSDRVSDALTAALLVAVGAAALVSLVRTSHRSASAGAAG